MWPRPPPQSRTQGLHAEACLSLVRLFPVELPRVPHILSFAQACPLESHQEALRRKRKLDSAGSVSSSGPVLGPEKVFEQEQKVCGPLRQPTHEIRVPLVAKRYVNPYLESFFHKRSLQIAAHSI